MSIFMYFYLKAPECQLAVLFISDAKIPDNEEKFQSKGAQTFAFHRMKI